MHKIFMLYTYYKLFVYFVKQKVKKKIYKGAYYKLIYILQLVIRQVRPP
jgi:hypothetical protein